MNAYTSPYKAATKPTTGLTLTELLVTTAIMAMMIAFTSAMLVPARKAIRRAQATVRANANARAVADRIRRDLAAIDREGFIAILTDAYGRFHLVVVTAGNYRSMVDPGVYANVARIEYGVSYNPHKTDDRGTPDDKDDDIRFRVLYRRAVLLNPNDNLPRYSMPDKDHERMSPRYYHMPLFPITNLVTWLYARTQRMTYTCFTHPEAQGSQPQILAIVDPTNPEFNKINEINKPIVQNLADLGKLWPFLVSEVADLESTAEAGRGREPRNSFMVQWTDGQAYNGHRWLPYYRRNETTNKLELIGRNGTTWMTRTAIMANEDLLADNPEFVLSDLSGRPFGDPTKGQAYCAFWCYTKRDNWPKALRISFRVGQTREPYEIIVDMPY